MLILFAKSANKNITLTEFLDRDTCYLQKTLAARKLKVEFSVQMQPFSLAQFSVATIVLPLLM